MTTEEPKITHGTCPYCKHGECYTEWPDGGYYCHSCEAKGGSGKPSIEALKVISEETYSSFRGITIPTCKKYGVTVGVTASGDEVRHTYPYPHMDKYRYLPKDFSKNKGFTTNRLFGSDKFNAGSSKFITVAEGEVDTLSTYQMLGSKYPVVGIPSSTISSSLLKEEHAYLNSFEQIIMVSDNDEAGKKAVIKLASVFPGKVYKVNLTSHKDPNEFLQAGHIKDFMFAWVNREKYVLSGVFNSPTHFKEILENEETNTYVETPIVAFNELCKGLMQGHLTVFTGPEGQGKTEVLRYLEYDILKNHKDTPIAVLHMEESKKTCLLSYASYDLGVNLRDPDHKVPKEDVEKCIRELTKSGNLYLFDLSIDEDPLSIMDRVRYLSEVLGCKYIFIDPIQQLAYGKDLDTTEEQVLSKISVQLERLATEFNVGIVMTSHVNDDGATRSSRMIGKSASVRVDIKRDHMNPDPEIRNITNLSVSKNRPVGPTGYGGTLRFDPVSFKLEEV